MKTVQQWLREVDRQELISTYQYLYPPEFWQLKSSEKTVSEVYRIQADVLNRFIDDLLQLAPSEEETQMIFLATSAYKEGLPDEQAILIATDKLYDDSPEHYGWMLTDRERLVGYRVADTELTLDNIYSVLAQILEESSFLGYSIESFEAERKSLIHSLEESMKDVEEGKVYTADEVWEHLELKPQKHDPRADELRSDVVKAEFEYFQYSYTKELSALKSKLTEEKHNEPHENQ